MNHTVESWAGYWMEHHDRPNVRPSTYGAHRYLMENHIIPGLGNLPLAELTEEKVAAFLEEVRLHGNRRPESKCYPLMSENTMRHIHRLLCQCLRQAVQDGLTKSNPAEAFRYAKPTMVVANPLSALEVEDYLDAAEELGHLAMFTLALTVGLREGELMPLLWSDLDAEQKELVVWEERAVNNGKSVVYGERTRVIPLPYPTVDLLVKEHLKHPSSPWMFPHPGTGRPYSPTMLRRIHSRILEKAGIDHIRLEDLRHTFAIQALQGGMTAKEVSAILGHTRPDFLARSYRSYLRGKDNVGESRAVCEPSLEELQNAAKILGDKYGKGLLITAQSCYNIKENAGAG